MCGDFSYLGGDFEVCRTKGQLSTPYFTPIRVGMGVQAPKLKILWNFGQ